MTELHTAMKTYQVWRWKIGRLCGRTCDYRIYLQICFAEVTGVERKLRAAEEEVRKYEEANKARSGGRKHKNLLKYLERVSLENF